jgi:hypothetical protein
MNEEGFAKVYGDTYVTFKSYYKYEFLFEGKTADGNTLSCWCGGYSDDIYRYKVTANKPKRVDHPQFWSRVILTTPENVKLFEWFDQ